MPILAYDSGPGAASYLAFAAEVIRKNQRMQQQAASMLEGV